MLKSNKHDPEADMLKYDRRQSMLSKRERKARSYEKHDTGVGKCVVTTENDGRILIAGNDLTVE